jgi:hypothetical protein
MAEAPEKSEWRAVLVRVNRSEQVKPAVRQAQLSVRGTRSAMRPKVVTPCLHLADAG